MDFSKRTNISMINTKVSAPLTGKKLDAENTATLNAWDDIENGRQGSTKELKRLERFIKRLQLSMTIFGVYLPLRKTRSVRDYPVEERTRSKPSKFLIYSIIVLSLLWGSFVRFIVSVFLDTRTQEEIILRLTSVCWQLQVCLNATIMVKASHTINGNQFNMRRYYSSKVLSKIKDLGIETETDLRKMNRNLLIGFILCWGCILFNIVTVLIVFVIPSGVIQDTIVPLFLSPFPVLTVTKVAAGILHPFNSVIWLLPLLYFVTMSSVLKYAFHSCERALQKKLTDSNSERSVFPENIEEIRFLHLDICKSVEILDRDFSYLLANLYATCVPLACLFTYALIKTQPDTLNIILCTFWGVSGACCIIVASGFAASLHESAHAGLNQIYNVRLNGVTFEKFGQVHLFLSKLTGTSIGFTVMGFFVVTKEVLLTVGGLFLTYVFLLIQF